MDALANPYDELDIEADASLEELMSALRRAMAMEGSRGQRRWAPVRARLDQEPAYRLFLLLTSRTLGRRHPTDAALDALREEETPQVARPDEETLRRAVDAAVRDREQRAAQLRELVDLPELPEDEVYLEGLAALDEESPSS